MTQQTLRSRALTNQKAATSGGSWHRETHGRHRDYSPTLGRFIERDPIGFEAGDNNWYRFVANGPTGTMDPGGLFEPDDDFMGIPMDEWFPMPVPQEPLRTQTVYPPCGELWADTRTPRERYRDELFYKARYGRTIHERATAVNDTINNSWHNTDVSPGYRATIDLFRPQGYQPGIGGTSNCELIVHASLACAVTAQAARRAPISARNAAWADFREAAEGRSIKLIRDDRGAGRVISAGTSDRGGPTFRPKPDGSYSAGSPREMFHYRPIPGGGHTVNER